jgi:hypothetical protein
VFARLLVNFDTWNGNFAFALARGEA